MYRATILVAGNGINGIYTHPHESKKYGEGIVWNALARI